MDEKPQSALDFTRTDREYFEAINPADGKVFHVEVTHRKLLWVGRRGRGALLEVDHIVRDALRHPNAIFEGIRWDEDDDDIADGWLCYVVRPRVAFRQDGAERNPYKDEVFLVFVNAERVVYQWRWEKCAGDDPTLPTEYERRFGKKVM